MHEQLKNAQLSKEEDHFHKLNKQLIEKSRLELDTKRKKLKEKELKELHWMKCPKCGQQMEEIEMSGIMVDICLSCEGIYFDKGELEILIESQKPSGFFANLKATFK